MLTLIDVAKTMSEEKTKKPHKWMKKAFANSHGQFKAKAEAAGESTAEFAKEKAHAPGKLGKQARLAEVGMHARKHKNAKDMQASMYRKKDK
jgi:hypothetical protein